MDAMDTSSLMEAVRVLKEEVERSSLHVVQLQRENDFLARSLLQLRETQQQQLRHSPGHSQKGTDSDAKEHTRDAEVDDNAASGPETPPSWQHSVDSSEVCYTSEQQVVEVGDDIPLCDDSNDFLSMQNGALRARVRALERQLKHERELRSRDAEMHAVEMERLRRVVERVGKQSIAHDGAKDSASPRCNVIFECCEQSLLEKESVSGSGAVTSAAAPRDEKRENGRDAPQQYGVDGEFGWCRSTEESNSSVIIDKSGDGSDIHPIPQSVYIPGLLTVQQDVKPTTDVSSSPVIVSASGATSSDFVKELKDLRREVRMDPDEMNLEEFLRLTTSRIQMRRQRLLNAVQQRTVVVSDDDELRRAACDSPTSTATTVVADLDDDDDDGDAAAAFGSPQDEERVEIHSQRKESVLNPPWVHPLRRRRLHNRSGNGLTSVFHECSVGSTSRVTLSASTPGGVPHSPLLHMAAPTNPNQLGVESDPKGPRNFMWYTHQVIGQALERIICAHYVEADVTVSTSVSRMAVSHEALRREGQGTQEEKQEQWPCGASDSLSSCMSNRPSSGGTTLCTTPVDRHGDGEVTQHVESPVAVAKSGMYRRTPSAAVQRAIDEKVCLHFRCFHNAVLMETSSTPFPKRLPPFEKENSDHELCATFAANSSSSPSAHRKDEVCITLHSPVLFSQIRSFLHMDIEGLRASLGADCVWRHAVSPGKSGNSLIYFGNFVMKSVKKSEFHFLRHRFLKSYAPFCERNPDTMLPRFFALLTLSWLHPRSRKHYVLMQNVFSTRYYIHRIYDLKGSTVGRSASSQKEAQRTPFGALLLKDNDLPAQLIICGQLQRAELLAQFRSDTTFLYSLNIVDYSCLIGVRSRVFSRKEGPSKTIVLKERHEGSWEQTGGSGEIGVGAEQLLATSKSCIHGCDGGLQSLPIYTPGDDTTAREDVYYLGIIDVLQEYTPAKRLENFAKGLWNDRRQISVVPPKEFAERLCKVLENITV